MICRPERILRSVIAGFLLAGLIACSEPEANIRPPIDRARDALIAGDAVNASVLLKQELARGVPRNELAPYLGEAALLTGDSREARKWLGGGDFAPDVRAHGFRMLGRLEMEVGNLPAAGKAFDRALATGVVAPELWVDIGRLRYRGGEQIQAIEAADRAVQIGPNNAVALQFRGQLARNSEGLIAGSRWFARALEQEPSNRQLREDYAAALGDAGQAQEALAVLRAYEGPADDERPRQFFLQAVIAARGHNFDLARNLLTRAGRIQENVPAALMLSAVIDVEEENFESAALTLDRLSKLQPDNRRVGELLALALSRSERHRELIHRFEAAALGSGASPYLQMLVAQSFEALEQRDRAAQFIDRAARSHTGLQPIDSEVAVNITLFSLRSNGFELRDAVRETIVQGDPSSGVAKATQFLARNPGSGDVFALLGDAELAGGRRDRARAAYDIATRVRQSWPLTLRMVAAQNDRDQVTAILQTYLRGHPSNVEAMALLAEDYAARGDWKTAAVLLDHAIAHGMSRAPSILAARSKAAVKLGDVAIGRNLALEAYRLQPMNQSAIVALIAALPPSDKVKKAQLQSKLRSLQAR